MVWTYHQSSGKLRHNGLLVEIGYSGIMTNKNSPDPQQVRGMGPLPRGHYRIVENRSSKGPYTLVLEQVSGASFGRSGFLIHGERKAPPPGWASRGCIILGLRTRERIWNSEDYDLEVVR